MDEVYTQLLIRIFGGPTIHQFRREHTYDYMDMMREFEVAKRNLKPDGRTSFNNRIPASLNACCIEQINGENLQDILQTENFPFKGQIKIIGDKLSIKSDIMKNNIFKVVTDHIVEHVDRILDDPKIEGCSLMLLVGGFSESPIVQKTMREMFQTEERRIIVPGEAGLSVVKGAAIAGHALNIVTDRVVRYDYGTDCMVKFDSNKHPEKYKLVKEDGSVMATKEFIKFMSRNTPVKEGTVVVYKAFSNPYNDKYTTSVYASSREVQFVDEEGCIKLCTIHLYSDDLKPYIGKRLDFENRYVFGRTEIGIEVEVKQTKTIFTASVEI